MEVYRRRFNRTSKGRPAIGPDDRHAQRIYITSSEDNTLFALNPADGSIEWSLNTGDGDVNYFMPAADPNTGVIYMEQGNEIRALSSAGVRRVDYRRSEEIGTNRFTPVVGNDGIVYVGGLVTLETGKLTALDSSTGGEFWVFPVPDSGSLADIRTTPAIAPDGTIYFGAGDGLLHALNPDGSKKWTFPIPVDGNDSDGHSSPTVGNDGVVYIGSSSDSNLYAVNDFAVPRNFRDRVITAVDDGSDVRVAGEIVTVDNALDWLNGDSSETDPRGPWAVRAGSPARPKPKWRFKIRI